MKPKRTATVSKKISDVEYRVEEVNIEDFDWEAASE